MSTEVIGFTEPIVVTDTTTKAKPHKPLPPMPPADTTDKVEIGWNPSVEDWEETYIDINL
jgi:hypothetical protein